jgi:hypothetical protein
VSGGYWFQANAMSVLNFGGKFGFYISSIILEPIKN